MPEPQDIAAIDIAALREAEVRVFRSDHRTLALLSDLEAEREWGRALRAAVEALIVEWEARCDDADRGKFAKREKWVQSLRARALDLRNLLAAHVPSPLLDGGAGEGDR